jgi:hypothetical protein
LEMNANKRYTGSGGSGSIVPSAHAPAPAAAAAAASRQPRRNQVMSRAVAPAPTPTPTPTPTNTAPAPAPTPAPASTRASASDEGADGGEPVSSEKDSPTPAPAPAPAAAAAPAKVVNASFHQLDMLATPTPSALLKLYGTSHLVTALFVVNELVQQDRVKAMETLGHIVAGMRKGSFLLVIDSFSNMSDVQVGGKTHRVHTLLDHLKDLRKATGSDSRWYRVPGELEKSYPIKMENVHYYYRLFQKTA